MDKWADYLISEVSYDANHLISVAIRHHDADKGITKGTPVDRLTISSDIKNGISYITIYSGKNSWKKGHQIRTFSINGEPFLRVDGNKVELDSLGDLPVVTSVDLDELDLAPEPVTDEPIPEPAPPSPRGSLPKESAEELPQELDLAPELEEEEATPEQFEQFEQLEKQIQELESKPEPEEEEATPEQFEQLDELQKQIDELETKLSEKPVPEIKSEPEVEPIVEEYSEYNDLEDQIDELEGELTSKLHPSDEATEEQISRVRELEKEIEKLESADIEHEIIQTLQKQNKKLDEIEKKLEQSSTESSAEISSTESFSIEAYCVKCNTVFPNLN